MVVELIDTHSHLHAEEFDNDRVEVLARARAAGVSRIILIGAGDGWDSAERALATGANDSQLWVTVGMHPCSADTAHDKDTLASYAAKPRVVALGETGLDYYWRTDNIEKQVTWFKTHIELAAEIGKPLVIHSRSAGKECLEILKSSAASSVGGVFHCFAEDAAFARELASINFLVSIPGIVTFKNAEPLRRAISEIPLSQILLETDAPYLAPMPHRGKRCESAFMVETAKAIAQIKGISLEELSAITSENAERLFRLA